ncbi:MAG: hypothetical protein D3909_19040, partial [Candidatus Electrothrix sp. ATG1]|nr:hypothetical protein [Candidatus Electrothrix sp. ATG1]
MDQKEKKSFQKVASYFSFLFTGRKPRKKSEMWGQFPEHLFLDPEKISEELGADSQGSLDGSKKIPPSNAVEYDGFHRKLIGAFKENFRHANAGRMRTLKEKERQVNEYELPDLSREMQRKVHEFSISLNKFFLTIKNDLEEAYKKSCESERKYTFFRTTHKRIDPPNPKH